MIGFYLLQAHGGKVLSVDDRAVYADLATEAGASGTAYSPTIRTAPLHGIGTASYSRLRRMVQRVPHDGDVTVTITPIRDGQESANAIERELASEDSPIVTAPMAETGTEFQVDITLSEFDADCGLGEAELWLVPRRTVRG